MAFSVQFFALFGQFILYQYLYHWLSRSKFGFEYRNITSKLLNIRAIATEDPGDQDATQQILVLVRQMGTKPRRLPPAIAER
jgi:hypothetical protein